LYKVFIDGKEGTTGLQIYDRFSKRNDIELINISEENRKDVLKRKECINNSDITFLCLPDIAAKESVGLIENDNVKIIDASTAHRTNSDWAYGFPELSEIFRNNIKNSSRVAVPGCHASGAISLIYPLISGGLVKNDYPFVIHSITGYSGGGKKMIAEYESSNRNYELKSPRQYALSLNHKHLPEIKTICNLSYNPIFNPIVADYYSGMCVTVPIYTRLMSRIISLKEMINYFSSYYKGQNFVKINNDSSNVTLLSANKLSGKNNMEINICGNDEQILLTSRFDNLGKGASGAAIQCMNIMLGIDETTSLI